MSLPCGPSVVPVAAAVAGESVCCAEAGGWAVGVGTDAYCSAFGGGGQVGFAVVELSSVELVAVFVGWDVCGGHGEGGHSEVWVVEGVYGVDSCAPV